MRKPQGYAVLIDPEDGTQEWDTRTCAHCQRVDRIPPRCDPADLGGLCGHCGGLICKHCVGKPCSPFLEQLDRLEAKLDARRSYGF